MSELEVQHMLDELCRAAGGRFDDVVTPIAPIPPSIRPCADMVSIKLCCDGAAQMLQPIELTCYARWLPTFRQVIAT